MGLFVLGLNHKECPVEIREKLYFSHAQVESALSWTKRQGKIGELVILSTCNRVEFYGFSPAPGLPEAELLEMVREILGADPRLFQRYFYRREGKAATHHLFRVASGLDSLVIGENEILGQLRDAFKSANEMETVHSLLYRLMEKALKVGKEVRTSTKINEGAVSVPSAAVELAEKIFGRLSGEKVMVLGTGEMSELALKNLKSAGAEIVWIASRNAERGQKLAVEYGADNVSMEAWPEKLAQVDILLSSTAAPHPIVRFDQVKKAMAARRRRPLFLIDIAVPRDVEAEVNSIDDVYLYNVDDLKGVSASNLKLRQREIQAAEQLVEKAVIDYQGWMERLKARPVLESFEGFLDAVLERELGTLLSEKKISEEQKNQLRERIRAKLMHPPLEKIKEASQNGGVRTYLEALQSLFGLDHKPGS